MLVHIPLFKVNMYFEFQYGRDMTQCQFLHNDDDNANAIAIPTVYLECELHRG